MRSHNLGVLAFVWLILIFVPPFSTQFARRNGEFPAPKTKAVTPLQRFDELRREKGFSSRPEESAQFWREADALVARFPNDSVLRRARLLEGTRGRLTLPIYQPEWTGETNAQQRKKLLEWQSPAQRRALAAVAREGEKRDPKNGFFAWMQAMALWGIDEKAALAALQRAAQAPNFDDGVMAAQRERMAGRDLEWHQKLAIYYSAVLPHYSQMRTLARELAWNGIRLYRRGDKKTAYARWKIALEAGGAMRRAQSHGPNAILIGLLVGEALQSTVWNQVGEELGRPLKKSTEKKPTARAKREAFLLLARRDGQNALAAYSQREYGDFESRQINKHMDDYERALGLSAKSTQLQLQLPWLTRNVFFLSLAGVLCLGLAFLGHRFFPEKMGPISPPQIAFLGALWFSLLGLAAWFRVSPEMQRLSGLSGADTLRSDPDFAAIFESAPGFWLLVLGTLALGMMLHLGAQARENQRLQRQVAPPTKRQTPPDAAILARRAAWVFWGAALFCAFGEALMNGADHDRKLLRVCWLALGACALSATLFSLEKSPHAGKINGRLGMASAAFALGALALISISRGASDDKSLWSAGFCGVISLLLLFYLGLKNQGWRPLAARALGSALQSLGALAVVLSLALLLVSLSFLPVRARQEALANDFLARGEVDWMRANLGKNEN